MTAALAHRGPDGEGNWQSKNDNAIFCHRRLSILDLSDNGSQPFHYLDRYAIIHNGEIYNYIELREILLAKGYRFHSLTDTEVIIAAYDCWKDECVDRFDGMFAFAIWDELENKFFAARDRFGEKPFFYHYDGTRLIFSSEMKGLWAAGVDKRPNRKMLFNFITIGYTDNPNIPGETFFDDIFKLPAACFIEFKPGSEPIIKKYWDLDPEYQQKKISDDEALSQFGSLLKQSIKRRLRSDVAIGTSLSGGLDSSSILALINSIHAGTDPLAAAFTAIFPGYAKDEQVYARQVAESFGLRHHTITTSAEGLMQDWEKMMYHQEEPVGSASVYPQYKVFELAGSQDVKVLLDGQGADEILAGYSRYYKWYWQELFRKRKLFRSRELEAARKTGVQEKFGFKNMVAAYFPDVATVLLEHQYLLKAIRHEDLSKEFVRYQSKEAYYTTPPHFTLNGALYFNTCMHGLEELLRYADRNAMAHGREVRLPFLSHELVEFVFSLPPGFKIRGGWTKWLLRESVKELLPAEIVWRKDKIGFEPPQKSWMENTDMQEAIRESKKILVKENILNKASLDKPVIPQHAHDAANNDWRYLSSAYLFK